MLNIERIDLEKLPQDVSPRDPMCYIATEKAGIKCWEQGCCECRAKAVQWLAKECQEPLNTKTAKERESSICEHGKHKFPLQRDDIEFLAPLLGAYKDMQVTMVKEHIEYNSINNYVLYVQYEESELVGYPILVVPIIENNPQFTLLEPNVVYPLDIEALLKEYNNGSF